MANPQSKHPPETYLEFKLQGYTNVEIANMLGVSEASVRRGLGKLPDVQRPIISDINPFDLDAPLVLSGDWVVTADWHVPLTNWDYVNDMVADALDSGFKNLLIAGDLCNMDSLSRFSPKQQSAGLEGERYAIQKTIDFLVECFDNIVYTWGNHDERLLKSLGFTMQYEQALRMFVGADLLEQIQFSGLDHVWTEDVHPYNGLPWYICHPSSYTRTPLAGARKMAAIYNANIMVGHSHHAAIGYAEDGEKVVVEVGGLHDRHKTEYLQRSGTFPKWQNGYVLLQGGVPVLRTPGVGR